MAETRQRLNALSIPPSRHRTLNVEAGSVCCSTDTFIVVIKSTHVRYYGASATLLKVPNNEIMSI